MDQSTARHLTWIKGEIARWYLRPDQKPIYELLKRDRNPFVECSRRFGKTTTLLCYAIEQLTTNPGFVCLWCEPDKNQAREIIHPELDKIFRTGPRELRPTWSTTDSFYRFHNGSMLKLRGINHDRGDSARGSFANLIIADEFGSWKDPHYTVNEVLRPQLLTTRGQFIFASTPAEDLGHPYYAHKERAVREDRFIQRTIYDNKSLSLDDICEEREAQGGEDSVGWQREYLCRRIGNPKKLVLPEFSYPLVEIANETPRPEFYDAYVGGDSGADDNTALLFGYYDFLRDTVVIEDEFIRNGTTSDVIAKEALLKEQALWCKTPYKRVYDADKQIILDLSVTHKYSTLYPEKHDKQAAIRDLRVRIKAGKLKIKSRCKILLYQMEVGQWANEKHLDFKRSEDDSLKHLDAIAAAVYLNRSIVKERNPYPGPTAGARYDTHWVDPFMKGSVPKENEALKRALGSFSK